MAATLCWSAGSTRRSQPQIGNLWPARRRETGGQDASGPGSRANHAPRTWRFVRQYGFLFVSLSRDRGLLARVQFSSTAGVCVHPAIGPCRRRESRSPGSSTRGWRTQARATSAAIRAATASNSSAFLSPQATTLAGQSLGLAEQVVSSAFLSPQATTLAG